MNKALATQEKLLLEGRRHFWSKGYSNVSLRQIAKAAGVDVALVARYFGSKRGLFEATIVNAFEFQDVPDQEALVDLVVQMFVSAPRGGDMPSILQLLLMNAHDPEVGETVRRAHQTTLQAKLERIIGNPTRAALFMAVILGYSVAEKSLFLDGIAEPQSPEYAAQLRHLLHAALSHSA